MAAESHSGHRTPSSNRRALLVFLLTLPALVAACASSPETAGNSQLPQKERRAYCIKGHGCYHVFTTAKGYHATGLASWYGIGATGHPTASGEPYDPRAMRIASKRLPFGTWVRIVNQDNGRQAVAMVDDRGPYYPGRIIDGTLAVAQRLGYYRRGTAHVSVAAIPSDQLSAAKRLASRADQRRAISRARENNGSFAVEAGKFAVSGALDVTEDGVVIGARTSWTILKVGTSILTHVAGLVL